ncbi:dynamin family protein [Calothrix sp. PCC 6303]|uniref:dynamin family protein n=1 Tax=Calothrix sp. PCC 6303 TaxID=1170562 RepID=UPI0002A00B23|nr:dynamin family protein [Calothrix sp. PCC 6303]AFZ04575.1 hypothetical protein Cal6303_5705 [Calothrix sp. PCC 6303]
MENLNEIKNRMMSQQSVDSEKNKVESAKREYSDSNTLNVEYIDNQTTNWIVISQFKKFFNAYHDVEPYIKIDETTKSHIENKNGWISRLEQEEFPVAFLGSFSAGKSTIINAIFKREILPEAVNSTTAFPTIIRKGEKDIANIYYIDEDAKNQLCNELCTQIRKKIDKDIFNENIVLTSQEIRNKLLEKLKKDISEYENKIGNKIESKPLETLQKLFDGWGKYQSATKIIAIDALTHYVEGHEEALFIDRIEVAIKNINIPDHVVLVDLPGLAVANERHIKFTKEYVQHKAKAFVVCMKPKSLLEGEEIKFLEEINRVNPTILQRSFWVINQWETLNDHQKKEEDANFYKKIKDYSFNITDNRFFKFTALNYFYLSCMADETLSETKKLKEQKSSYLRSLTSNGLDDLSKEEIKNLLNYDEIKSFLNFVDSLFNYLGTVAQDEFIKNAKSELLQEVLRLQKLLIPDYTMYGKKDNFEIEIQSVEVDKQVNAFIGNLEGKVERFGIQMRNVGKIDFWKESNTIQIEQEISRIILQLSRDVTNKLRSGYDNDGLLSRLPSEVIDKLELTFLMRDKLVVAVEEFFLNSLGRLLLELKEVNKDYLPESLLKLLEDKLGKRDIEMRLKGLADALFFQYGDEIERISFSLNECQGATFEERVGSALEKYKNELKKFIRSLVDDLNKYVRRSVKNHTQYVEQELLKLFVDERERIVIQIANKINLSEVTVFEQQKKSIISNSYNILTDLKRQL